MSIPAKLTLYALNDQFLEIDGLADGLNPASFINGAVVTVTLKDSSGVVVPQVNALVLTYLATTNGNYRGQVTNALNPTIGGGYTAFLDVNNGGIKLHMEIPAEVKIRKS
jgi:hypothetical protein